MKDVIKIFTGKSFEDMLEEGGSAYWKLNRARAAKCEYVLLVRNMHAKWSKPGVAHGTAFMLGKISGVTPYEDRFIIHFSEYADLNRKNSWDGSRNPVGYTTLVDEKIDLKTLTWKPYPGTKPPTQASKKLASNSAKPLTLAEAKLGLAAAFGIDPDQIEINIKA